MFKLLTDFRVKIDNVLINIWKIPKYLCCVECLSTNDGVIHLSEKQYGYVYCKVTKQFTTEAI